MTIEERIATLRALEQGWDGHYAPPISEAAFEPAQKLATACDALDWIGAVRITPTSTGGITIEADFDGGEIFIDVEAAP